MRTLFVYVIAAVAVVCIIAPPAWAYVDPSVMTYTIQALAGVAVALGAVAGVAWRRLRSYVYRALEIDPDHKKVVEADVCRIDCSHAPRDPKSPQRKRTVSSRREPPSWPIRLLQTSLAAGFAIFSLFFFPALEIVAGSAGDLLFTVADVALPLCLAATGVSLAIGALFSLFERGYAVAIGVCVAVGVCAFLQASVLNASLPAADGSTVNWQSYLPISVVSVVVWVVVMAVFVMLACKRELFMKFAGCVVGILLIATQAISLGLAIPASLTAQENYVTEEGLFTVSPKSNTVVFVLDSFDNYLFPQALEADPTLAALFPGFTYYSNATGSIESTRYAMPYLLTGDMSLEEGAVSRWTNGTQLLGGVSQRGYSVGLYSTSLYYGSTVLKDIALNIHPLDIDIKEDGAVTTLGKCALYRCLPWPFKPGLRFYTDELNATIVDASATSDGNTAYITDDAAYYATLASRGLAATDTSSTGAFRLIHLNGTHSPYYLDMNAADNPDEATVLTAAVGSLKIVGEYIAELQRLGVYDQTCIIVTADHGATLTHDEDMTAAVNPLFLIKPAGDSASSAQPLAVSAAYTGHVDYPATVVDSTGGDASAWSGVPAYRATTDYRERSFIHVVNALGENKASTDLYWEEYVIKGDANDFSLWSKTGRTWPIILPDY